VFLLFPFFDFPDESPQLCGFLPGEPFVFDEKLHHRRQGAVEGPLEHSAKLASSGFGLTDAGAEELQIAYFLDFKKAFFDHPVHSGLDGAVGPVAALGQGLLDGAGGAGLLSPDNLDNGPFGFGKLRSGFFGSAVFGWSGL